ncbi:ATP-dependent DNA helicase RecG [uncultured Cetobacterium sp.]|uniref:ATP-dependent DNA helicase RecG n=1 Tax=uncultured Cetobacterium sp. TaxID=527638 RepID=UPI002602D5F0|nr:ATP-dependent DNA helicase RecG [uncultured Cetobacterium sp.]
MYEKIYEEAYFKNELLGPKNIFSKMEKNGINNIFDLLYYFPKGYDNRGNIKKIGELKDDEYVVLKGILTNVSSSPTRTGRQIVKGTISDGTGIMDIIWFQRPYLKKTLKLGEEYIFIGTVKKNYIFQIINPEFRLSNGKNVKMEILPIYSVVKEVSQNLIKKNIKEILNKNLDLIEENIPLSILQKYNLLGRKIALKNIHYPLNPQILENCKKRFAIEELLILEMGILQKKYEVDLKNNNAYILEGKKKIVSEYIKKLKFSLTKAQKKVITEIYNSLNNGKQINYLIQGDVGSGKTIVAILLLIYMVDNGYQGTLMAPTEILATQHYLSIYKELESLGIKVELLTGAIKGKKRDILLKELEEGKIDIIIGTHAIIEDNIKFKKLGLIVIDEQHRFGVIQRKKLRDKGMLSNLIVMSATPIPRSLALTIYGDLDVLIIDELPPGRKPIKTKWISNNIDKEKMYEFIRKKLKEGRQVYFVASLIEESEKLLAKSLEEVYLEVEKELGEFKIGTIHGRMKSKEKEEVMNEFSCGELQILISTLVIEVGVNVPNASIMTIFNGERFGLSTLHQLRGRVGRGEYKSYCFLLSDTKNEVSISRLEILENTEDGFKIAEEDLKLRKSGEVFGIKQSGLSDLKFVDIVKDIKLIKFVKDICIEYLKENNGEIKNKVLEIDINEKFNKSLTS